MAESLTPEQMAKLIEFREEWLQKGLRTERAPRLEVEAAIGRMRGRYNRNPAPVLWFDGPASALLFVNTMEYWMKGSVYDRLVKSAKSLSGGKPGRLSVAEMLKPDFTAAFESPEHEGKTLAHELEPNAHDLRVREQLGDMVKRNGLLRKLQAHAIDAMVAAFIKLVQYGGDAIADDADVTAFREEFQQELCAYVEHVIKSGDGNQLRIPPAFYGSSEVYWIAYYLFPHYHIKPVHNDEQLAELHDWAKLAESGWWFPFEGVDLCCEPPKEIHREDERLHNDAGPAISFRDGWSHWSIRGVTVDEQIVMTPSTQTIEQINREGNAEVKRIRIERYGWQEYLTAVNAKVLEHRTNDIEGTEESLMQADDMVFLVGACPSTGRIYAMEVDPECRTCAQAQEYLSNGKSKQTIGSS